MLITKEMVEFAKERIRPMLKDTSYDLLNISRNNKVSLIKTSDEYSNTTEMMLSDKGAYFVFHNGRVEMFSFDIDEAVNGFNGIQQLQQYF